eukprot:TRINITY_DN373_c0_g1_i8.p1 TRINITY_DN373_c0_g1~~TRINITY_DN373_c0_g1_i8.p1  ORF type:complete len:753 (+),score=163.82 TRINITY_DN373_c0_g1_i8:1064-3322(+)
MSTVTTLPRPTTATWMGHPSGLFLLFFVEMWERFSYYGMRSLLLFYMIKGFLKLDDAAAYGLYGVYTALVYATPFIGGMLADKLLGSRRAVVLGGMLMAAGHLLMTYEDKTAFSVALGLLICGNGFFKPNISTMVGAMYPPGSPRRDSGFTIFYMGINLGAAMSPLICGYVGETFGWHWGFGLATIGMLTGLMTFVADRRLSQILIGLTALVTASSMVWFHSNDTTQLIVNAPVGIALIVAAFIAIAALAGGGIPESVGEVKDAARLKTAAVPKVQSQLQPYYLAVIAAIMLIQHVVAPQSEAATILMIVGGFVVLLPWLRADAAIYLGTAAAVPVAAILIQNPSIAGILLGIFGGGALVTLVADAVKSEKVERERMYVVLILMFFSMLFWAFFEQAGSSISNFTDRNVDRIIGGRVLSGTDVGQKLDRLPINSAMLGRSIEGRVWDLNTIDLAQTVARETIMNAPESATNREIQAEVDQAVMKALAKLQEKEPVAKSDQAAAEPVKTDGAGEAKEQDKEPQKKTLNLKRTLLAKEILPGFSGVVVTDNMVGMKVHGQEVKASIFQAVNAMAILVLGLPMTFLWLVLNKARLEPNTAVKFAMGLLLLGLGFGALWMGSKDASSVGIVAVQWLLLGYVLHTLGELCLSPVGLSMVTRLSPARLVSTVMGAWFLATAFSNFLAGMIAALTGISEGGKAGASLPADTVAVYGDVFGKIAIAGCVSGLVLLILSPLLVRWMHEDKQPGEQPATAHG